MKERPIIFNTEMVKAILEGRKTQTRRVIKLTEFQPAETSGYDWMFRDKRYLWNEVRHERLMEKYCPWNVDQLWVRETWAAIWPGLEDVPLEECRLEYRADADPRDKYSPGGWPEDEAKGNPDAPKWRPSIHMPRWASRITLEIKRVNWEPLQSISATDACKEGIIPYDPGGPIRQFSELWDNINKKRGYGWDSNPWVWVIEFRRI